MEWFVDRYLSDTPFVLFPLAIVLPVHLRFTDSVYPVGIFKLFCNVGYSHIHFTSISFLIKYYNQNVFDVSVNDLRVYEVLN